MTEKNQFLLKEESQYEGTTEIWDYFVAVKKKASGKHRAANCSLCKKSWSRSVVSTKLLHLSNCPKANIEVKRWANQSIPLRGKNSQGSVSVARTSRQQLFQRVKKKVNSALSHRGISGGSTYGSIFPGTSTQSVVHPCFRARVHYPPGRISR